MESKKLSRKLIFVDTEVVGMILEQFQKFSAEVIKDTTKHLPKSLLKEYLRFMLFRVSDVYQKNGIEKEDFALLVEYFNSKILEQKIMTIDELIDYEEESKKRYVEFEKILSNSPSGADHDKLEDEELHKYEFLYLDNLLKNEGEQNALGSVGLIFMIDSNSLILSTQTLIYGISLQLDSEKNKEEKFNLDEAKKRLNRYSIEIAKKEGWPAEKIRALEITDTPELSEEEARRLLADLVSQESNQYLKDKRFDKAEQKAIEALDLKEECTSAWGTLGLISLMAEKKFSLAVLLFKMALRYDKFFILHYYLLAQSYFSLGNYLQALITLTEGKEVINSKEYREFKEKSETIAEERKGGPFPEEGEELVEDHLNKLKDFFATDAATQKLWSRVQKITNK